MENSLKEKDHQTIRPKMVQLQNSHNHNLRHLATEANATWGPLHGRIPCTHQPIEMQHEKPLIHVTLTQTQTKREDQHFWAKCNGRETCKKKSVFFKQRGKPCGIVRAQALIGLRVVQLLLWLPTERCSMEGNSRGTAAPGYISKQHTQTHTYQPTKLSLEQ